MCGDCNTGESERCIAVNPHVNGLIRGGEVIWIIETNDNLKRQKKT
jgi:hypothetical protein